jgi:uncharacterized integral membrane protein
VRGFGQTLLILCIIIAAVSVLAIFTGNQYETTNGIVFFGSALVGMIMSGVLITLVDIRNAVRITAAARRLESDETDASENVA